MPPLKTLAGDPADAHQQLAVDTVQTLLMESACRELILSARAQSVAVTFDDSTPSATNGIVIVSGQQPVRIPLGYHAHGAHNLKAIGLAAGGFLDVLQIT
jgi:hypothetical protein